MLTGLSTFWFERTAEIVPNHLISVTDGVPERGARPRRWSSASSRCCRVECVVRGYLTGSGWKDYQRDRRGVGIELPAGLRESDRLPEPIFTPATKADVGHDETIDFEGAVRADRRPRARRARPRRVDRASTSTPPSTRAQRGIILADTKFEFGLDADGTLTLGDEVCTPDSSRFWPADQYEPGRGQPSFDKQFVRDWASSTGWDRNAAGAGDPRRRRRAHAREVRRGLRADHRRAVRRRGCARTGAASLMRARVLVRPKAGILDPQGQAVERALPALGFTGVTQRPRRPADRARGRGPRRGCRRCASGCWPTR